MPQFKAVEAGLTLTLSHQLCRNVLCMATKLQILD